MTVFGFWCNYSLLASFRDELHMFVRGNRGSEKSQKSQMMISMVTRNTAPGLLQSQTNRRFRSQRKRVENHTDPGPDDTEIIGKPVLTRSQSYAPSTRHDYVMDTLEKKERCISYSAEIV